MAWEANVKRAIIADYVNDYFQDTEKSVRDDVTSMSQPRLESELFELHETLGRQTSPDARTEKNINRLRVMEFVSYCNTQALDPQSPTETRQMHEKLRKAADGYSPTGDPLRSTRHKNRLGLGKHAQRDFGRQRSGISVNL